MADYRVNLDVFAGPLDLLLYLVRKDEVDIYDISISKITDQYLHYIGMLKTLDIDLAGDFLVMAATMMQMKSSMLLPKADPDCLDEEDFADPRAELIRQLLEYKKFKDASNLLGDAAIEHGSRHPRPDTIIEKLKPTTEPELDLEQVNIWDLLEAFDSIMAATGSHPDISHITDDTPIDLYQIEILQRLQTEGAMTFERIFEVSTNRLVMIGLFLALLELIREKLIWVEQQPEASDSIFIKALTDEPAEQAVKNAILSTEIEIDDTQTETEDTETEADNTEAPTSSQPPIPIVELPAKDGQHTSLEYEQQIIEPGEKSPDQNSI